MLRLLLNNTHFCDTVPQEALFCYLFTTMMFWLSTAQKLWGWATIEWISQTQKWNKSFSHFSFFSPISHHRNGKLATTQIQPNSFKSHGFHQSKYKSWFNFLSTYRCRTWWVPGTFTVDYQFRRWFILRTNLFTMKNSFTVLQVIFNFSESPFIHLLQNFSLVQKFHLDTSPNKSIIIQYLMERLLHNFTL